MREKTATYKGVSVVLAADFSAETETSSKYRRGKTVKNTVSTKIIVEK